MVKATRLRYGPTNVVSNANCYTTKRKLYLPSLIFILCCFIIVFFTSITATAQVPTQCGGVNCTSNDVAVTGAKIADINGDFFKCSKGTPVSGAYLFLTVSSNSPRVGVFISLTLTITIDQTTNTKQIQHCFTGVSLNGSNNILPLKLEDNLFICGSTVTLSDVFTAWGTGNTDFCAGTTAVQCPSTKSKCRFVKGVANFVQTTPCTGATIIQDPASDTKCVGGSASFTAKFIEATSPSSTTYKWQGCTGNCGTDASWSDVANINVTGSSYTETNSLASGERTTTLTISNLTTSLNGYKYRVLVTNVSSEEPNKPCPAPTNTATLNVDAASVGGTTVATNSPICLGTGTTITLSGNTGAIQKWQSSTNGTDWSDIASTANPYSTGNLNVTTQFRAVVKSGVCSIATSDPVTVSIDAPPTTASVGGTQERCGTLESTSLGGNTPNTGTGTWSKQSGPGDVTFSSINSGSSTASVSEPGIYVFTWTISNGTCPSSSADITVKYYDLPSNPSGSVTTPTCSNSNGSVTITTPLDENNIDYEYRNGSGTWTDNVVFTVGAGATYSIVARNKITGCVSASAFSGTMAAQPATPDQPAFSKTNATCSAGGSITITNYNASYTYVLTGPSPATTTQTLTAATTGSIAAGDYTLTASQTTNSATCTSAATNISIGAAAGVPDLPTVGVKTYASCSSAAMTIEVTAPTPSSDYEFKNGNGNWQTSNEFTINAGAGYEIYARRKSDNTCVSAPQTCTPVQSSVSQKNTGEAAIAQTQKTTDINARIGSKTKVLAAPNPFSDKVRFTLQSDISGQGSLEIFNTMGQRIAVVYQGYVEAGKSLVKEYHVPESRRANLIYVFRVGDQKTTGKLLNW